MHYVEYVFNETKHRKMERYWTSKKNGIYYIHAMIGAEQFILGEVYNTDIDGLLQSMGIIASMSVAPFTTWYVANYWRVDSFNYKIRARGEAIQEISKVNANNTYSCKLDSLLGQGNSLEDIINLLIELRHEQPREVTDNSVKFWYSPWRKTKPDYKLYDLRIGEKSRKTNIEKKEAKTKELTIKERLERALGG